MERREVVEFEPNAPVEVALAYAQGRTFEMAGGRKRVMFTLVDGRTMFLDEAPAEKVHRLGVRPREPFFVAKYRRGNQVEWNAWLATSAEKSRAREEMPASTRSAVIRGLPTMAKASAPAPAPIAEQPAAPAAGPARPMQVWTVVAQTQVRQMIDIYAASVHYAENQHKGVVSRLAVLALTIAGLFFKTGKKGA